MDAPLVIKWLEELGVMFDKDSDGNMVTMLGGGCYRKRMLSAEIIPCCYYESFKR